MQRSYPKKAYTVNYRELRRSIGTMNLFQIEPYGVLPDMLIGIFFRDRLPISVVSQYPELHVLSIVDCDGETLILNRHAPDACFYFLGNGNPDPTLELLRDPRPPEHVTEVPLEIMKAWAPTKKDEERMQKSTQVSLNLLQDRHPLAGVFTPAELADLRERAKR